MRQVRRTDKVYSLSGTPLVITEDHHEVLPYWIKSGIQQGQLLHIDAHSDMNDEVSLNEKSNFKSINAKNWWKIIKYVEIDNFICPAVHYEIVSSMFWLNPHSAEKKLQEVGFVDEEGKPNFGTKVVDNIDKTIAWNYNRKVKIEWENYHRLSSGKYEYAEGIDMFFNTIPSGAMKDKISPDKPYILDVDLDAFCGDRDISNVDKDYERLRKGVENYEQRIADVMDTLNFIRRKPDLITITRSQGDDAPFYGPFVPPDLVEEVQSLFLHYLGELYKK